MGQIIMSFAYVIIALGVSHALGSLAEGGHVKLLKLMAWQNLADADDGIVTSSLSSTSSNKNMEGGVNIQGLLSGYTYMVQLITGEIRKAYRTGQHYNNNKKNKSLVTTTSYTSPSRMLSRYASNLNTSFQEVYNTKDHHQHHVNHDVKDDMDSAMNWKEYSKLLQKKKKKGTTSTSRWSRVLKNGSGVVYNKFAMMFERDARSDSEGKKLERMCSVCVNRFV